MANKERTYRNLTNPENLLTYNVTVKETDLFIHSDVDLKTEARELILTYRGQIESYIEVYPDFETTLTPWTIKSPSPEIIQRMIKAGELAGTGPMAAVAGAIAEMVGNGLLKQAHTVIIENGGDVFIKSERPVTVGVYAGKSPVSMRIGLHIDSSKHAMAVCTSSGTIGHSLSMGVSDAVCVVSDSCFVADAAATAIANRIQSKKDFEKAMSFGKKIQHVNGIIIIINEDIAIWGDVELVQLNRKKS